MNIPEALISVVRRESPHLTFNMLEIGARPVDGRPEPFHVLIEAFPGSRIDAFEVDSETCDKLNESATAGVTYHAVALGRHDEERPFYMTRHPMCASLYKSNERFIERYQNLEVAMLVGNIMLQTANLDSFTAKQDIPAVDFIKIDIQGAELDVFQGGTNTLRNVVAIVTEVEFVHMYESQPLFGDVSQFLSGLGFAFHKFLHLGGRTLKPVVIENNPNFVTQHMWADAAFVRDLTKLDTCTSEQLLKLAILTALYGSVDISVYALREYDARRRTDLCSEFQLAATA
jgi:FkbM family methyltransferase